MAAAAPRELLLVLLVVALVPERAHPQIPTVCTDAVSLATLECCPDACGAAEGRGRCEELLPPPPHFNMSSSNVRDNWPHYFTRVCHCFGNYAGYDCSRCKFGYYGESCEWSQVLPRRSLQDLTDQEWREYNTILRLSKTHSSDYRVVLAEEKPGTTDLRMSDIDLYDLYVWMHHYAAKGCPLGNVRCCVIGLAK